MNLDDYLDYKFSDFYPILKAFTIEENGRTVYGPAPSFRREDNEADKLLRKEMWLSVAVIQLDHFHNTEIGDRTLRELRDLSQHDYYLRSICK